MQAEHTTAQGEQQGYVDLRGSLVKEEPDEPAPLCSESEDEGTAQKTTKLPDIFQNRTVTKTARGKQRNVEEAKTPDQEIEEKDDVVPPLPRIDAATVASSVVSDAQREELTPLERHLRKSGLTDDHGSRLARVLAQREESAASSARRRSWTPGRIGSGNFEARLSSLKSSCPAMKEYEEFMAFFAYWIPTPPSTA